MQQQFGASPEAWDHFANVLGLADDLLPVVSNPHAIISDASKMKQLGKTPSIYNREGRVAGLSQWTKLVATKPLIEQWSRVPDYGIALQTRKVRAIDIDVDDRIKAAAIASAVQEITGPLPTRGRGDSGKMLLGFTFNRALTKRVVPVDGGIVEILGDGQQFIAQGMHPSGERYGWVGGLPKAFPVLTGEQFEKVWALLTSLGTGEPRIAREKRKGSGSDLVVHDPVADWLMENWEVYDVGADGQVFIECPFAGDHTSDSGPSSTAYFPAGTGGYSQGHFVCLHAHCVGREDAEYLDVTGFNIAQFEDLTGGAAAQDGLGSADGPAGPPTTGHHGVARRTDPSAPWPDPTHVNPWMRRDGRGKIEPSAENLFAAVNDGAMIFKHIAYDAFTDNLVWAHYEEHPAFANWQRLTDADVVDIRVCLEKWGFKAMSRELLRDVLHASGSHNTLDSAISWLSDLRWDGVPRIHRFATECWGWHDNDYSAAVGRYVWTALAGRVLQPGVRADMAPILVGAQGIKKTSAIQAMAPYEDAYCEVKLDEKEDDLSRKFRGKLVGELEELRGLNTRAIEEIKAFVSRRRENWIPKYKEFENFFWRRCILIGSTNDWEFLADPTGERRWLPGFSEFIDLPKIVEWRDQLWAEGAVQFAMEGVAWADAERLAEREHPTFKVNDSWELAILRWIDEPDIAGTLPADKGFITVGEVMSGAIGIATSLQNRAHQLRVERALKHLGFKRQQLEEQGHKFVGYVK